VTEPMEAQAGVASALFQAGSRYQRLQSIADDPDNGSAEPGLYQFVGVNGSSAELTEKGYADVAGLCCHSEMTEFVTRVVLDMGLTLCGKGGPDGIAPYYMGCGQTQSLFALKSDINGALGKDCPWVTFGTCPVRQQTCPDFPNDRRRRCVLIESRTSATSTTAATAATAVTLTTSAQPPDTSASLPETTASMLAQNNLGGRGPNLQDARGMVFKEVGKFQGENFDLVIENITEYIGTGGGLSGKFAFIQVHGGFSADFTFSFRRTSNNAPLTLPEFHLGVFDIDQSLKGKMTERLIFSGHEAIVVDPLTEVGLATHVGGAATVNSLEGGDACDNPRDPLNLKVVTCKHDGVDTDIDQRKRSAVVVYKNVAQFTLTLESTCANTCTNGRIFYFACASALDDHCA